MHSDEKNKKNDQDARSKKKTILVSQKKPTGKRYYIAKEYIQHNKKIDIFYHIIFPLVYKNML